MFPQGVSEQPHGRCEVRSAGGPRDPDSGAGSTIQLFATSSILQSGHLIKKVCIILIVCEFVDLCVCLCDKSSLLVVEFYTAHI